MNANLSFSRWLCSWSGVRESKAYNWAHIHAEQAGDESADADAERADGDLEVESEEGVAVRVEDELDNLLCGLDVCLESVNSERRSNK